MIKSKYCNQFVDTSYDKEEHKSNKSGHFEMVDIENKNGRR
ncbi:MAG: hypothetical protein NTY95_06230 [Bacteroidia bacterium]|nr:hypothetical protein [Bacteroidia bacterium]